MKLDTVEVLEESRAFYEGHKLLELRRDLADETGSRQKSGKVPQLCLHDDRPGLVYDYAHASHDTRAASCG